MRVPAHALPPRPTVTSVVDGATGTQVYWQGSAGAANYSVQRAASAGGRWVTVCRRCVTDRSDGYVDVAAAADVWYRLVPYNLDGKAGPASKAKQASPS